MIKSIFSILIFSFAVFSCSQKNPTSEIDYPIQELQFEVYDSLLMDVMEDVTILDYQEELDQYLMKEKDPVKIGGDFYNQVKSGFHYDLR